MISDEMKELIKNRADILEVIAECVGLKKSGMNYVGLCPFHREKSPSFTVSASRKIYKCFGCGCSGDVIEFVREFHGMSFTEAVEFLALKYAIDLGTEVEEKTTLLAEIYAVLSLSSGFYHEQLKSPKGKEGLEYLKERGIDNVIDKFYLGYAGSGNELLKFLSGRFSEEAINGSGLVRSNPTGDMFRCRVMFPVRDFLGRVRGFGGRTVLKDTKKHKYINSPATPAFDKSKSLYGLYEGREAIRRERRVYIVEGYTDIIAFHYAGIENCAAVCGTSLTTSHIETVGRYADKVIMAFDGDSAGQNAVKRGFAVGLDSNVRLRAVIFPDPEDPFSFITNNRDKLNEVLEKEYDIIDMAERELEAYIHDPDMTARGISELKEALNGIQDQIKREAFLAKAGRVFNFETKPRIKNTGKTDKNYNNNKVILLGGSFYKLPADCTEQISSEELNLFALLMIYPVMTDYVRFYCSDAPDIWSSDKAQELYETVSNYLDSGKSLNDYAETSGGLSGSCLVGLGVPCKSFESNLDWDERSVTGKIDFLLKRMEMKRLFAKKSLLSQKMEEPDYDDLEISAELEAVMSRIEILSGSGKQDAG